MGQVLHGRATTTEAVRRAIQHSQESLRALAKRYWVNPKMIAKWKARTSVSDLPTGPITTLADYSSGLWRVRLQWGHRYGGARARMASTARRIAGSVGLGGPWRILFSPARLGEAAALQVGVRDHRHERVAVQAMPGSAFEVIEAEFFLKLLVGLLAHPSRLDRGGKRREVGVGRQVGKIVFALARGATLADEPDLLARHVLHAPLMDALWRTIGDPHAHGGEGGRQTPFGAFTPADASPLCGGENLFSRR